VSAKHCCYLCVQVHVYAYVSNFCHCVCCVRVHMPDPPWQSCVGKSHTRPHFLERPLHRPSVGSTTWSCVWVQHCISVGSTLHQRGFNIASAWVQHCISVGSTTWSCVWVQHCISVGSTLHQCGFNIASAWVQQLGPACGFNIASAWVQHCPAWVQQLGPACTQE